MQKKDGCEHNVTASTLAQKLVWKTTSVVTHMMSDKITLGRCFPLSPPPEIPVLPSLYIYRDDIMGINPFKTHTKLTPGSCAIAASSPRTLIPPNYHCVSWCSLQATLRWSDASLDAESSQWAKQVQCIERASWLTLCAPQLQLQTLRLKKVQQLGGHRVKGKVELVLELPADRATHRLCGQCFLLSLHQNSESHLFEFTSAQIETVG